MKATKRTKTKRVLAGASGLRISNPPSVKPFKGFWWPVQEAGKFSVPSSLCLPQVIHHPLDAQKEGRILLREGSCEEQAPQIEAQVSKLQPGSSNSDPVPLLAPETWLRARRGASCLPAPKGMKGLKNPRGLDALDTVRQD